MSSRRPAISSYERWMIGDHGALQAVNGTSGNGLDSDHQGAPLETPEQVHQQMLAMQEQMQRMQQEMQQEMQQQQQWQQQSQPQPAKPSSDGSVSAAPSAFSFM